MHFIKAKFYVHSFQPQLEISLFQLFVQKTNKPRKPWVKEWKRLVRGIFTMPSVLRIHYFFDCSWTSQVPKLWETRKWSKCLGGVPHLGQGYLPWPGSTYLGPGGTPPWLGVPTLAGGVPNLARMGYPPPEQTYTCENVTSCRTTYADGNKFNCAVCGLVCLSSPQKNI